MQKKLGYVPSDIKRFSSNEKKSPAPSPDKFKSKF